MKRTSGVLPPTSCRRITIHRRYTLSLYAVIYAALSPSDSFSLSEELELNGFGDPEKPWKQGNGGSRSTRTLVYWVTVHKTTRCISKYRRRVQVAEARASRDPTERLGSLNITQMSTGTRWYSYLYGYRLKN